MKRLPIIPTIIVAAAVAVMIGLGIWQLQRAEWKNRMLAELAGAPSQTLVDINALPPDRDSRRAPSIAFRRVRVTCYGPSGRPAVRIGRNAAGQTGFGYFLPCFLQEEGYYWSERLHVNVGWASRPDVALTLDLRDRVVEGQLGEIKGEEPIILTSDQPIAPLQRSAPPRIEDIPNNHLAYAGQWFFFAAAAAIIFVLALRGRRRP